MTGIAVRATPQVGLPLHAYDQLAPLLRDRAIRALQQAAPGARRPLRCSVCCVPGCVELTAVIQVAADQPGEAEQGRQLVARAQSVVLQLQGEQRSSDFTPGLAIHMVQADQQQLLALEADGGALQQPYSAAEAAEVLAGRAQELTEQQQLLQEEAGAAPGSRPEWSTQPTCLPVTPGGLAEGRAVASVVLRTSGAPLQQLAARVRVVLQRGTEVLLDLELELDPLQPEAAPGAASASIR
jgi:hypothetical protein